jgi:hypothetical protein
MLQLQFSVSSSDACPFSPKEEAVMSATGLCENSIEETVQSMAFF